MAKSDPIDVDLTFGYSDGSLRTYYIKGFVVEQGSKVIGIQPHKVQELAIQQHSKTSLWPSIWQVMGCIGLASLIYQAWGAWGLLIVGTVVGVLVSWFRHIFRIAKQQQAKKVLDASQSQRVTTSSIRSES